MAKGFKTITAVSKDIEARKNSGGGDFVRRKYLRLPNDGDTAQVRFLESGDEVQGGWYHQTNPDERFRYGRLIPCIDQDPETAERVGKDCPGCDDNLKRKFQGVINLIWRDAPVYAEDDDGKPDYDNIVGYEDQVVLWQQGIVTFEELQIQDETYGLDSRDFLIRRRGTKLNTKYSVNPVDGGPKDLTKADKELAAGKYDLNEITEPPSYENWGKTGNNTTEEEVVPVKESPFARARR